MADEAQGDDKERNRAASDGAASIAIMLLAIALIVFLVSQLVS